MLEFTVVRLAVFFSFDPRFLGFVQVIWVIGVSMIVLAALIQLPLRVIALFGLVMIAFHNPLDGIRVESWKGPGSAVPSVAAKLWIVLHQPFEVFPIAGFPSPVVFIIYPLVPWIGVMVLGYVFGFLYQKDAVSRRRILINLGSVCTALFFILRLINFYGDPSRWSHQKNLLFTILSFLNTTKYPPSLQFLLMTLGPSMLALVWFESTTPQSQANNLLARLRRALKGQQWLE